MANCNSNTLFVSRPSAETANSTTGCTSSCLGLTDPVGCGKIGPRKNREKVREQLKDYCLLMLGAPVVKVELNDQNLDAAVDLALQIFEDYCPRDYFTYYTFITVGGQSVYQMPADVGIIRNVYYKETGNFGFYGSDVGGALPIEYYYPGGSYSSVQGGMMDPNVPLWGKAGEWALYKGYEHLYSRMSSQLGGWEWLGGPCGSIKLYPVPCRSHCVSVHYLQKKPDFKQVTQVMQEGAYIYARIQLANIRRKYSQIVAPGGGALTLDGDKMMAEAREDQKQWFQDLLTKFGDIFGPQLD